METDTASKRRILLAQLHLYVDIHLLEKWLVPPLTLIVTAVLTAWLPVWKAVTWAVIEIAITAFNVHTYQAFKRCNPEPDDEPRWRRRVALAHGANMVSWSSLIVWAWLPGDFNSLMFIMLVQAGLVSLTVAMSNTHRRLLYSDLAPPALAMLVPSLLNAGWLTVGSGVLGLAYTALMLLVGLKIHACTGAALKLRQRNEELIVELERQASHDSLTGVANRRQLLQSGRTEIQRSLRFEHPMAVMILDIDHFKRINDTWGHLAGDEVLKAIADACMHSLRTGDSMGRLGGEEFAIILTETSFEPAMQTAQRLRQIIESLEVPLPGGAVLRPTASVGVTLLESPEDDIVALLHRADLAMYGAKREGRNRVAYCSREQAAIYAAQVPLSIA